MNEITINLDENFVVFCGRRISYPIAYAKLRIINTLFEWDAYSFWIYSNSEFVRISFSDMIIFLIDKFEKGEYYAGKVA